MSRWTYITLFFTLFMLMHVREHLLCQNNPSYIQYTTRDGLPSNLIYEVVQDEDGFIWIGTNNGISRFDGKSFQNFGVEEGLKNLEILGMVIDQKGRKWLSLFYPQLCYMEDNVFHYLPDSVFTVSGSDFPAHYTPNDTSIVIFSRTMAITLLTEDLTILFQDEGSFHEFRRNPYRSMEIQLRSKFNNTLRDNVFSYSKIDRKLCVVDQGDELNHNFLQRVNGLLDTVILNKHYHLVYLDRFILFQTSRGLHVFDSNTDDYDHSVYLPRRNVQHCFFDRDNNLWISTESNGLYKFSIKDQHHLSSYSEQVPSKPFNSIRSLQKKGDQILINQGSQISMFRDAIDSIQTLDISDQTNLEIIKIRPFGDLFYILTMLEIFSYDPVSNQLEVVENDLHSLLKPRYMYFKEFHVLNHNHFLLFYDLIYEIKDDEIQFHEIPGEPRVSVVHPLNDSILLIGSQKGVFKYSIFGSKEVERIDELPNQNTIWIGKDSNERIIFVFNNGLIKILRDSEDGLIEIASNQSNGLIYNSATVHENHLAVMSSQGLLVFRIPTLDLVRQLDVSELGIENSLGYVVRGNKNYVVASNSQLALLDDSIKVDIPALETHIESSQINGGDKIYALPSYYSYDQRDITINFSTPYFQNLSLKHEFQLVNHDKNPIRSSDTKTTYSNLPPGTYHFKIKPALGEIDHLEYSTYTFQIAKPWWKTHIFYFLTAVGLFGVFYYFYQQAKIKEQAKSNLLQYRLNAIHAQMNPHFLFNGLQSIQYYIVKKESKKAIYYLNSFSTLVRKTLESSAHDYISMDDEIAYLNSYLLLKKEELDDNLSYEILLDNNELRSVKIPSMVLQPFLENAFVHGFANTNEQHKLHVTFKLIDEGLVSCTISDNGEGLLTHQKKKGHRSFASKAIDRKLKLINQLYFKNSAKNTLELTDNRTNDESLFTKGTTVKIVLPILD